MSNYLYIFQFFLSDIRSTSSVKLDWLDKLLLYTVTGRLERRLFQLIADKLAVVFFLPFDVGG